MNTLSSDTLLHDCFDGVLLGTLADHRPDQPGTVHRLTDGDQTFDVVIPNADLAHRLLSKPLLVHRFQLVDLEHSGEAASPAVVTDAWTNDHGASLWYLPADYCPARGVLSAALGLVDGIDAMPLRDMVRRVLQDRTVTARFWTMPASGHHHHAGPGGLARHSLEVARDLSQQACLDLTGRDLLVAAGLLHDIGKVWAYQPDMTLNDAGRAMGHELIAVAKLEPELRALESQWPDGAYVMRVLLSGTARPRLDGSMPSSLLARLRAADQYSCELDRGQRPAKQWTPSAWQPAPPT